jgi:hypothetical protein
MHDERMKGFRPYVGNLERLVESLLKEQCDIGNRRRIHESLNGQPSIELRNSVSLKNRKADGVFFTGSKLAHRLTSDFVWNSFSSGAIADVGCGAGDLLLACAKKLPLGSDLNETLQIWGQYLIGFDIHPELTKVTKIRLVLLAINRGALIRNPYIPTLDQIFPMIRYCDFLSNPEEIAKASHVVMNPPYNNLQSPPHCEWASGKVNAAAIFVDTCLSNAPAGARISAILPDVLRSGSNYIKWRQRIEKLASRIEITTCGQFDDFADIHVFMLKAQKDTTPEKYKTISWIPLKNNHDYCVGDHFEVHVGAVVPHRDRRKGPRAAYIHAKALPPWEVLKRIGENRRFSGTLFGPPFVLVRRTSRPGEKRAIATIVTGKRKVAVENHLVVLLPRIKTVDQCNQLLKVLKSPQTDRWLDKRIRCRHLTIYALKDVPWWRT